MILRVFLSLIWTATAVMAGWSLAFELMPAWLITSLICCIAIAWAIVMWKMSVVASALHAFVWLFLLFFSFCYLMALMIGDLTIPDWVVLPFFLLILGAWLIVLKFKLSLKWPLIVACVLALLFGLLPLGVIGIIGIGKLIIECIGRRNILASSRINVNSVRIPPRGLVEYKSFGIGSDNRGFGIAGLIVGTAILLIALTMAASSFYSASRLTKQAANFSAASNFAEGVIERVRVQPFASIHTTEIKTGIPKALNAPQCTVNVDTQKPGLKEVTVTCSWSEGKRQRKVQFSTLVAKGRTK